MKKERKAFPRTWNYYGFKHPFDLVGAAYVADEPVMATLTRGRGAHKVYVVKASADDVNRLTVTLDDDPREVVLTKDDVMWAARLT